MKKPVILILGIVVLMAGPASPPSIDPISDMLVLADNEVSFTATAFPSGVTWALDPSSLGKGMQINASTGLFSWTPESADFGNHTVTVSATDAGGTDNVNFLIQVTDLILDAIGPQFVDEQNTLNFTATATIPGGIGGAPVYTLEDGVSGSVPSGASINSSTGLFEWQTSETDGPGFYEFDVVATATDPQTFDMAVDQETISVDVFEVNAQHTVSPIGNMTVEPDTQLAFTSTVQDPDIPMNQSYFWTLDATSLSKGMQINNSTGEFTWTPTAAQIGNHSVTVTIEDDGEEPLSDSLPFNIEVALPGIILDPVGNQSVDENLLLSFTATASVPDQGAVPVFSLDDGFSGAVPSGASIDSNTGIFSWQTNELDGPGSYEFDVVATRNDNGQVFDAETIFVDVFEVNEPPIIDPISDMFVDVGSQLAFTATAFDPDQPANATLWSLDETSLSKGMSINFATGDFTWTPTNAQVGSHVVTVTVSDDNDPVLEDDVTFNIDVSLAIDLDPIQDPSVNENSLLTFTANAIIPVGSLGPGLTIQAEQVDTDVVFSWGESGQSLDLLGMIGPFPGTIVSDLGNLNPGLAVFQSLPAAGSPNDVYTIPSFFGWGSFGANVESAGIPLDASLNLGSPDTLSVPSGYVSGSQFPAGTLTFPNTTLFDLGVDTSTVHTLGVLPSGDTITLWGIVPIYSLEAGEFGPVPSGATIDPDTGVFQWLPGEIDGPGFYSFDVVATRSDDLDVWAAQTITVEVVEVNEQPLIDPINDMSVEPDSQLAFTATAFDPDEPLNVIAWSLDTSSVSKGMGINSTTGEFSWIPTSAQAGNHPVTIFAADDGDPPLIDSLVFNIDVSVPRSIILDPTGDQSVSEGDLLTFTASATPVGGGAAAGCSGVTIVAEELVTEGMVAFSWGEDDCVSSESLSAADSTVDYSSIGVFAFPENAGGPGLFALSVPGGAPTPYWTRYVYNNIGVSPVWGTSTLANGTVEGSGLGYNGGNNGELNLPFGYVGGTPFAPGTVKFAGTFEDYGIDPQGGDILMAILPGGGDTITITFDLPATVTAVYSLDNGELGLVPAGATIDPMSGVFSWQTNEADGPGVYSFDVVATRSDALVETVDFTGVMAPENWSTVAQSPSSGFSHTPSALSISTGGGGGGTTRAVTIPQDGTVDFDWSFQFTGSGGFVFQYEINDVGTSIAGVSGSGSLSGIEVHAGDVFEIYTWGLTQASTYTASISAFNYTSGFPSEDAVETISVEVFEVNTPPSIDPVPDMVVEADSVLAFNVTAQDTDDPLNSISWTLDNASQTKGMGISVETGNFSWTPTAVQGGIHSVTVTATDDGDPPLNDSFNFDIDVTLPITLDAIGDQSVSETGLLSFTANATVSGMAVPIYTLDGAVPNGAAIDTNSGAFSWQTTESDGPGTYIFDVVATRSDNASAFATETISVEVFEVNLPPLVDPVNNMFVEANTVLAFNVTAQDTDVPLNSISWTLDGTSQTKGMSIDPGAGNFTWTPTAAQAGSHTVTVTATDDGNLPLSDSLTFNIEVTLSIILDPVGDKSIGETNLLTFIANATIPGGMAAPIYTLDGSVPSGASLDPNTGVFSWQTTENDGPGSYVFDVVATRSDNAGVFDLETITVDVLEGNVPPTIDPIGDMTADAGTLLAFTAMASDPDSPPNTITWTIDDSSEGNGMSIDATTGVFSWTPAAAQAGSHSVTVTATDNGNPPLSDTFTFNIEVTLSITLDLVGDKSITETSLLSFTANATIPGGIADPVYTLDGSFPDGASINSNTGVFFWQTTESDGPGSYTFDVVATRSDNAAVFDSETITVDVFEGNTPPTIDPISDMSVDAGTILAFPAIAFDPDIPPNGISWSIDGSSDAKGMSINSTTGVFTWTPTAAHAGSHSVTVTATDDGDPTLSDTQTFTIDVILSITLDLIGDQSVGETNLLTFTANATIPGGIAVPVYSLAGFAPSGASIDPGTGVFSWQTTENDGPGSYLFDVVARRSDDVSVSDVETIFVGVFESNLPPTIDPFNDLTVDAGTLLAFTAAASDPDVPPNGISWTIDDDSAAKGMDLNFATGAFSWTPSAAQAGDHLVSIIATDNGDPLLSDSFTFIIEVTISITLDLIGDQSIGETNLLTFTANATVPGDITDPIYSLEGAVPSGAVIDSSTGTFTWQTTELDGPGSYIFDVVAARTDNASITDRESISIGVFEGNTPPTIDAIADMAVDAGTLLNFTAMASDPDVPPNGISWSIDDDSDSKGMQIDFETGAFSWSPTSAQAGDHLVTITATDDGDPLLSDAFTFAIEVTLSITLDVIGDKSIGETSLLTFTANATIPGDIAVPVFSLEGSVPNGASIDPSSGTFTWQTDEEDGPGSYVFDVVAARSDNTEIRDRETISVGVFEGNTPPTIDPIGDMSVDADVELAFTAIASDPDVPPNGISWSIDRLSDAKGMQIDAATGVFSWTPISTQAGSHLVTVTATDDGDSPLTDTFTFTIEVTLSITLDSIGDQSIDETNLLSFTANATVPGGNATPIYSLEGAVPSAAFIDPDTGIFSWQTNEEDGPGSFVFDVVAARSDNAEATDRETISVGVFESNAPPTIDSIGDITVDAGAELAFTASAFDPDVPPNSVSWSIDASSANKGMGIDLTSGEFSWSPTSAHAGIHSVTITATDNGDPLLSDTFTFSIEVTVSIFLDPIGDRSIGETNLLSFTATATTPGGNAVPVFSLEGAVPGGASIDSGSGLFSWQTGEADGPGSYVFDVVAARSDNATITDRETISIGVFEGNTPPTIEPIANRTVGAGLPLVFTASASDPDLPPNAVLWSIDRISENKGMSINFATGTFNWTPSSVHAGNHLVTVTATDNGDPPLTDTFRFTIQVTLAISLDPIGDHSIAENSLLSFTASAVVPGGTAMPVFSLAGSVPEGAAIDPSTGRFSWQTDEDDGPGSYVFDVVAARSDNTSITDRETISVSVLEGNTPPIIAPISDMTVAAGTLITLTARASDPDVPPNGISWAIDSFSMRKGMQIDVATGAFSWTPTSADAGNHSVTVTANDNGSPSLSGTFTFTIEVTLTIDLELIGDKSIGEGSLLGFTASAIVPGGLAVPIFSLEGSVPNRASIDPNTGSFSWQTDESDGPGSYVFDVVAARSDNPTVTDRETISVGVFEGNTPPTIDPISDMTIDAGMLLGFTAKASDPDVPPNGISWTIDDISAAKGMRIDVLTGAFSWTPVSSQAGNHSVTLTVTDDGDPLLNDTFTFTIEVTLSIDLEMIGDKSIGETSLLSFTASAAVPGGVAVAIYSLEGSVPDGASIDPLTGDFSWQTDENDGPGSYVFDVVAARSDRATVTDRETITVGVFEGNTPPTIDPISDMVVDAGMLLSFAATASDPDVPPNGISWAIDGVSVVKGLQINPLTGALSWTPISSQAGDHQVTVTATDNGDPPLSDSFTFTIEVTLTINLELIGDKSIAETSLLSFTATASVPGGVAVPIYSLEGSVPREASINPFTGVFSWQTNENDGPSTHVFDVVAVRSDNTTIADRETISVGVFEGNAPPSIDPINNMTVNAGSQLGFTATASDLDVPPNDIAWAIDTVSAAKGMGINFTTGAFDWTPSSSQAGSHSVTVIAVDNGVPPLDDSFTFTIEVTSSITLDFIGDQSVEENTILSFTANATAPGGNASPIYSLQNGGSGSVPNGASIDANTGVFRWEPNESDGPGSYVFDVEATRSDNPAVTARETITVGVFERNTPPVIDAISNMTVKAGAQLAFSATAIDPDLPPNGVNWTIDGPSVAKGMGINPATGAFSWTPASANAGNHSIAVTATDNGVPPLSHTVSFQVEVTLTIILDPIGDQTIDESLALGFTAAATVPGGNATPIFSLQDGSSGSVPGGASIDPSTGVLFWQTGEIDGPGTYVFDVVAVRSDDARISDRETISVQVIEVNAPPLIDAINDTSIRAGALLAFTATASDPDLPANAIAWKLDGLSEAKGITINNATGAFSWPPTVAQVGNHSVTVTATDNGTPALEDSLTFSIEVTPSTIELNPIDDQTVDETSTLSFTAAATVTGGNAKAVYSLDNGAVGSVPDGASIDPGTGDFRWTTGESDGPGAYVFDVVATRSDDASAIDRDTVSVEILEVNESPSIDPINDATVEAFTQLKFTATASDPDLPVNLISWSIDNVSANKGMSIDGQTGTFNWVPIDTQVGNHSVVLTAQDSGAPALDDSVAFTIEVTGGEPPVVSVAATGQNTLHEPDSFSLGQNTHGQGPYDFNLTRSTVSGDLPVTLRLEESSLAGFGSDFNVSIVGSAELGDTPLIFSGNPPTADLTFPDEVETLNIRIDVIDDDAAEAAETITLSIVSSERFKTGDATATQIIAQNDLLVTDLGDYDPATTANGGEGTLRHAINNARAGLTHPNDPDAPIVITFASGLSGEIILAGVAFVLDNVDFSIVGPGSDLLTINANGSSRHIIANDNNGEHAFNISGLHLTNGFTSGNGGAIFNSESLTLTHCTLSNSTASHGGGITNEGEVTMERCLVTGNTADVYGGGIDNFSGTAIITGCTVTENQAEFGGGIETSTDGEMVIDGCTINGNDALSSGGGVDSFSASTHIVNSTVSGNTAGFGAGVFNEMSSLTILHATIVANTARSSVGGILTSSNDPAGTTELYNTIVAGNTEGEEVPADIATNNPSFTNLGSSSTGNLIGDADSSGGLLHGINLNQVGIDGVGVQPLDVILEPLADNGGPTTTHALVFDSPAISAGDTNLAVDLAFDQRGNQPYLRTVDLVDIGAFEVQPDRVLEVVSCAFTAGSDATITWRSTPGTYYDILCSTDLEDWIVIATEVLATDELSSYTEENPPAGQAFFVVSLSAAE